MEPNCYQFPQIVISSGEKGVWPDGNAFGVVLSGERHVWSDGGARSKHTPRAELFLRNFKNLNNEEPL